MEIENGSSQPNQELLNLINTFFDLAPASGHNKAIMMLRQDFFDSKTYKKCSPVQVSDIVYSVDTVTTFLTALQEQINKLK
jgi:hypothetical protein